MRGSGGFRPGPNRELHTVESSGSAHPMPPAVRPRAPPAPTTSSKSSTFTHSLPPAHRCSRVATRTSLLRARIDAAWNRRSGARAYVQLGLVRRAPLAGDACQVHVPVSVFTRHPRRLAARAPASRRSSTRSRRGTLTDATDHNCSSSGGPYRSRQRARHDGLVLAVERVRHDAGRVQQEREMASKTHAVAECVGELAHQWNCALLP